MLAARLKAAFISDVSKIKIDENGQYLITKPVYHGKFNATFSTHSPFLVVTIPPGTIGLETPRPRRDTETIRPNLDLQPDIVKKRFVRHIKGDPQTINIGEAEIVIGIGYGVKNGGLKTAIGEVAKAIGASVGGTRKIRDLGWISSDRLIGQSGKYIAPNLYLALGVSGAVHHTLGVKEAKYIIAINTDKAAPIFQMADLSIIGDVRQIVPVLLNKLSELGYKSALGDQDYLRENGIWKNTKLL